MKRDVKIGDKSLQVSCLLATFEGLSEKQLQSQPSLGNATLHCQQ
jgi:hypothetical protein